MLQAHAQSGEKQRTHRHYLKGSLFCARCGARMTLTNSRGRTGEYYLYWFCLGRQRYRTCTQPFIPNDEVERAVERYYATIDLEPSRVESIRVAVRAAFEDQRAKAAKSLVSARRRIGQLQDERHKVLDAYYASAITLELLREEQHRIEAEIERQQQRCALLDADFDTIESNLETALNLVADAQSAYMACPGDLRRQYNQTLFSKLFIDDGDVVTAELTPPFAALLANDLIDSLRTRRASERSSPKPGSASSDRVSSEEHLVGRPGLEPGTCGLKARCSAS